MFFFCAPDPGEAEAPAEEVVAARDEAAARRAHGQHACKRKVWVVSPYFWLVRVPVPLPAHDPSSADFLFAISRTDTGTGTRKIRS